MRKVRWMPAQLQQLRDARLRSQGSVPARRRIHNHQRFSFHLAILLRRITADAITLPAPAIRFSSSCNQVEDFAAQWDAMARLTEPAMKSRTLISLSSFAALSTVLFLSSAPAFAQQHP